MTENKSMTAEEMKIQALLERISEMTTQYESKDADRRVALTILGNRLEEVENHNQVLREAISVHEKSQGAERGNNEESSSTNGDSSPDSNV